jgi:hypothetical protein
MEFVPGDTVPVSGVYRVQHNSHRLMHEATLLANTRFPRCKRCKDGARFKLVRVLADTQVLPFRSHAFLEEYTESGSPDAVAV